MNTAVDVARIGLSSQKQSGNVPPAREKNRERAKALSNPRIKSPAQHPEDFGPQRAELHIPSINRPVACLFHERGGAFTGAKEARRSHESRFASMLRGATWIFASGKDVRNGISAGSFPHS